MLSCGGAEVRNLSLKERRTPVVLLEQQQLQSGRSPERNPTDTFESWTSPGSGPLGPLKLQHNPLRFSLKSLIANCSQLLRRYEDCATVAARKKRTEPSAATRPQLHCGTLKEQFLATLKLAPGKSAAAKSALIKRPTTAVQPPAKLSQCANIPFSSDVGRKMAERENHRLSEEVKMRRLERSEWYVNRARGAPSQAESVQKPAADEAKLRNAHVFKPPKRQNHQRRPGMHDAQFLMRFCSPVSVRLQRFDQPVVLIAEAERNRCDAFNNRKMRKCRKK